MGIKGIVFILILMSITIVGTYLLGKKLGFNDEMSLMMSGGNAVCGSSAIGAIAPSIDAKNGRVSIITVQNSGGSRSRSHLRGHPAGWHQKSWCRSDSLQLAQHGSIQEIFHRTALL